jgi:hypothetical protein
VIIACTASHSCCAVYASGPSSRHCAIVSAHHAASVGVPLERIRRSHVAQNAKLRRHVEFAAPSPAPADRKRDGVAGRAVLRYRRPSSANDPRSALPDTQQRVKIPVRRGMCDAQGSAENEPRLPGHVRDSLPPLRPGRSRAPRHSNVEVSNSRKGRWNRVGGPRRCLHRPAASLPPRRPAAPWDVPQHRTSRQLLPRPACRQHQHRRDRKSRRRLGPAGTGQSHPVEHCNSACGDCLVG